MRALTPHVGAYLELAGGDRLGVLEARAVPGELATGVLDAEAGLRLGCGAGALELLRVRPAGGPADGRGGLPARPPAAAAGAGRMSGRRR